MSYRVIDVFVSQGKDIERVSEFAVNLAGSFGARLCVQFMDYYPNLAQDPYGQVAALLPEIAASNRVVEDREKASFSSLAERNGVRFQWRSAHSNDWLDTMPMARASDLIVMGQPNPDDSQSVLGMEMASHVLLQSGRPVLFLPYAMQAPKRYGTIAIAWDGSRQAARAISDAMPFLDSASEVLVLSVTKEKDAKGRLPDVDLGAYLAEHDLKVKFIENSHPGVDAGNWLLSTTADMNVDLLVMGGYGHSRFGEMMLGGVTHTLLKAMTLPTLMSH